MDGEVLNIAPVVVWSVAVSQLLTLGLTLYNLFAASGRHNVAKLEEHATALQRHDQRISAVEQAHLMAPTRKDFHDLEMKMTELNGGIAVLGEKLRPLQAITDRMQDIMIEQGGKK